TGKEQAIAFKNGGFSLTDSIITEPTPSLVGTDTIYDSSSEKADFVKIKKTVYKSGDVNGDDIVNITDITLTAAQVKGKKMLSTEQKNRADVNSSGSVNITDIIMIAAHVKGKKLLV
ncbi:MAG: dockerin type I repeat-containing protein, partial [Ruminococcus sp.]|nr:dockerin type I repeat-containing protein [Ruminococcus sp.]